jgi:hypothetical protein
MTCRRRLAAALALALAALAGPTPAVALGPEAARARIVSAARRQLGQRFRGDCSGFVLALLRQAGVEVALAPARSRSESLFLASRRVEAPRPGDLAFFHDTYDRNRDGRANDPYTHVALVEAVEGGAVLLVHRSSRGIERVRMDLARPSDRALNDPVRHVRGDGRAARRLAGELFAGYGAVLR